MEASEPQPHSSKETSRIESFSDGVFAIAITLLILDIKVPELKGDESLMMGLYAEWASFLALLIGFFVLLICWINHHYMFQLIHRSNGTLLVLNGFKLLVVTLTPFATALLSKNINTPQQGTAVSIFCLNFAFMGIAMTGIWNYAVSKGFAKASPAVLQAATRLYMLAALFSTAIWFISFFSMIASLALSGIMFGIFLVPNNAVKWQVNRNQVQLGQKEA